MNYSKNSSEEKIRKKYLLRRRIVKILILALILTSIFTLIYLLSVGELYIIPYDIIWLLMMFRLGFPFEVNLLGLVAYYSPEIYRYLEIWNALVFDIRMPRILLAFAVGIGLSITGVVMQGLFKNPLADSYILGISSGAGLGATLTIYFNLAIVMKIWTILIMMQYFTIDVGYALSVSDFTYNIAISLFAFIFSCLITFLVYFLARRREGISVETLLLAGIALSFIFSSITQIIMFLSLEEIQHMYLWGIGGFGGAKWVDIIITGPFVIAISSILMLYRNDINVMVFEDDVAKSMGTNVQKTRRNLIILVSIETAICVAFVGPIAFIGLICPHIIRLIVGNDHRSIMPVAALFGGLFLVWMDFIAQTIMDPVNYLEVFLIGLTRASLYEKFPEYVINYLVPQARFGVDLPVGIITSLIGGPFFIILLLAKRKRIFLGK